MFTILAPFLFLLNAERAEIEIEVDAGYTIYCVKIDDQVLTHQQAVTQPLFVPIEAVIDILWLDGTTIKYKSIAILIYPGMLHKCKVTLPRASPFIIDC